MKVREVRSGLSVLVRHVFPSHLCDLFLELAKEHEEKRVSMESRVHDMMEDNEFCF